MLQKLKLIALLTMSLSISSCSSVQRPDAYICGINAPGLKLRCYNIKSDFDENGVMHPNAQPKTVHIEGLSSLNGGVYFSPGDLEKLKVWLGDLRNWSKNHCN